MELGVTLELCRPRPPSPPLLQVVSGSPLRRRPAADGWRRLRSHGLLMKAPIRADVSAATPDARAGKSRLSLREANLIGNTGGGILYGATTWDPCRPRPIPRPQMNELSINRSAGRIGGGERPWQTSGKLPRVRKRGDERRRDTRIGTIRGRREVVRVRDLSHGTETGGAGGIWR